MLSVTFLDFQPLLSNINFILFLKQKFQICDYDMRILSVDPRYPGGVPATDIWSVSTEKDELERCYRNGVKHVLLADSDFPIEPWLITPFILDASSTHQQINFNRKHALASRRILKCLTILQERFEILQSARYPAEKMTKIVNACCALYNIALENGCFSDLLCDVNTINEENVNRSLDGQMDDRERNPYYNIGSQVRHEMMLHLSD